MPSTGLVNSLNRIRELSSDIYHQYIPLLTEDSDISTFGQPILNYQVVQNEFMSALINRIAATQFEVKYFNNPLRVLEGDRVPFGHAVQDIAVNKIAGRKFDVEDFAGLLAKYEADVKVQYLEVNSDIQYPVTITKAKLQKAFSQRKSRAMPITKSVCISLWILRTRICYRAGQALFVTMAAKNYTLNGYRLTL